MRDMWDHPLYKEDHASDLIYACECNKVPYWDLQEILLEITGENDGEDWHWIVKSETGFAYIHGGCDYTGWDCQSNAERFDADSLKNCLILVGQDERRIFEEIIEVKFSQSAFHVGNFFDGFLYCFIAICLVFYDSQLLDIRSFFRE